MHQRPSTNMPTSYAEADTRLGTRQARKIANNTTLERHGECIALRLHSTVIVSWTPDDVVMLNSGGYRTVTTKARMNAALRGTRYGVHQVNYQWKLWDRVLDVEYDFEDGDQWNLSPDDVPR